MKERLPILSKIWLGIKYQMDLGLARHLLSQLILKIFVVSEKSKRSILLYYWKALPFLIYEVYFSTQIKKILLISLATLFSTNKDRDGYAK